MADYETKENLMDELIESCSKQLKMLTEDPEKSKYPLFLYLDFICMKKTILRLVLSFCKKNFF